ncbi:hypothetical protein TNIN_387581 [Trichonephila inaurata madagascariensis]|uniref:Uncharacterized protein n=1 Tax=Trichonephila inaurata madagascariensis TaxID=2747483 RepID=A0A8X6YB15_9ARAC|nr:hypothetical protein TNIN_387581 [Trichonephila inaurata madagascariensis]
MRVPLLLTIVSWRGIRSLKSQLMRERAGGMKCARESFKFDSVVGVQDGPFADLQADITTRIALSPEPVTSGCRTNQI